MQASAKCVRHGIRFVPLIEGNRLPNVIDHDLARVTARQMLLELLADARIDVAIDVFTQSFEQFFTFHVATIPHHTKMDAPCFGLVTAFFSDCEMTDGPAWTRRQTGG